MGDRKKYIRKSANGRFFLLVEEPISRSIDMDKKTSLWTSSDYLIEESIKEDPTNTLNQLEKMIWWNTEHENYEMCSKLSSLRNRFFAF
jgi:hypothetical protein